MRRNTIVLAAACMMALALMTGGCRRAPEQKKVEQTGTLVETAAATTRDMEQTISLTGTIRAYKDVTLVSEVNAIISRVAAREGDRVRAGQVVIQLDTKDATSRVQQAQAALASATAMANQAQTGVRLQQTQTSTGIQQAQAGLSAARDRLRMLETGARPQERLVAEAAVRQAQAGYDKAEKDLARAESLFKQGAVAEQQVDATRTALQVAAATLDSAKQQLSLVKEGPRTEEVEVARSQVRQAEEALRLAKAGQAQVEMRRAEVKTALAAVGQARATLDYAQQQLNKTSITSPIDGVVYARKAEPGEVAGGFPLMMIADLRSLYFEASASELQVAGLSPRDRVIVSVDGLPRRRFEGRIEKVVPVATPGTRDFMVRIQVDNPSGLLRPGMFSRGEAVVARHPNAVVVPSEAVMTAGSTPAVFVVENGVAHRHEVDLGVVNSDVTEIEKGVSAGDQVVVVGQQTLSDGDHVRLSGKASKPSGRRAEG
jgi:HlyD family secretion protein